jgi:hypothetical protein
MVGGKGLAEAQRRFTPPSQVTAARLSRQWVIEDLFDRPGARGEAHAAARAGNASAHRALENLATALAELETGR